MWLLSHMWNLKNITNEQTTKQKQTRGSKEQTSGPSGEGEGRRGHIRVEE